MRKGKQVTVEITQEVMIGGLFRVPGSFVEVSEKTAEFLTRPNVRRARLITQSIKPVLQKKADPRKDSKESDD